MPLQMTTLFACILTVFSATLWINVTKTRSQKNISIGDAGDANLHERFRKHGNFIEWVPLALVLMGIAELRRAEGFWLYLPGSFMVPGRMLRPFGLKNDNAAHALRIFGNSASLLSILGPWSCLVWTLIQG